jgi:hypothetical protein
VTSPRLGLTLIKGGYNDIHNDNNLMRVDNLRRAGGVGSGVAP